MQICCRVRDEIHWGILQKSEVKTCLKILVKKLPETVLEEKPILSR